MTILCRESRLYSIAIFLLPSFALDKNICKNKRVPLTENNKTIYNPLILLGVSDFFYDKIKQII